jgi:hypothetical protein
MNKLNSWDFSNIDINSSLQLINRQKSALDVKIVSFDKIEKVAVFSDANKGIVKTNLQSCECDDFNLTGGYPRKKFQPCKHIYRLAIELGLINVKHISNKTRLAAMTPEERRREEVEKLLSLPVDDTQWGSWNEKIHRHWSQKERQFRAYEIKDDKNNNIDKEKACGEIGGELNDYHTNLTSCTCPDFEKRKLPCKHIYCLAILLGIRLLVSRDDFVNRVNSIRDNPLISIGYKNGIFFAKDHISEDEER